MEERKDQLQNKPCSNNDVPTGRQNLNNTDSFSEVDEHDEHDNEDSEPHKTTGVDNLGSGVHEITGVDNPTPVPFANQRYHLHHNRKHDFTHLKGRENDKSLTVRKEVIDQATKAPNKKAHKYKNLAHVILEHVVLTQYYLKQGIKKFGDPGKAAVLKEIHQFHD